MNGCQEHMSFDIRILEVGSIDLGDPKSRMLQFRNQVLARLIPTDDDK